MTDGMQQDITPQVVSESPIRWSESIAEFAKALPKAQSEIQALEADATNKHLSKDYASLGAVLQACLTAYNTNGFSVMQIPTTHGDVARITTRILHESGEWMENDLDIRAENQTAQKIGTAQTYGKRYSLASICGLAVTEESPPAIEAAAKAMDAGKRLTKAQARDLFEKMQSGLRNQRSARGVNGWLGNFDAELKTLPVEQEKELRAEAAQEIEAHEAAAVEPTGAGF
jgi:hypothetical protein